MIIRAHLRFLFVAAIGCLIGLVVDLISGASNNLEPDNVHADLIPANSQVSSQ